MPTPFTPGAVLGGRYALERRVADDGLTERWTATDEVLARGVIIEALSPTAGTEARAAFAEAVAAAARLVHPGIVSTYDSGSEADGTRPPLPYVVTERTRGLTLGEVVRGHGALSPARTVAVGRQLARALEAAHRAGVQHGGIDADTVLFGEDDRVKLARFVACGVRTRLGSHPTPDVAALGATLADALVGGTHPPPYSPRALRPGVPASLDAALVDAQSGAFADAGAFAGALEALDVSDDAEPTVTREITPPMGVPPVGRGPAGPPPASAPVRPGSRTGMIGGIIVGALLLVGVAIAAFVLAGGADKNVPSTGGGTTLPGVGRAGGIAIVGGHSFNPLSPDDPTKHENEALVPKLYDGDPATTWSTVQYTTRAFGNLKSGTGVYIQLDRSRTLHQLTVTSPGRGWTFRVYVANQPGNDLSGWGNPVAGPITVTADVTQVDLHSTKGAAVLVWITQLADTVPYHVEIGELAAR